MANDAILSIRITAPSADLTESLRSALVVFLEKRYPEGEWEGEVFVADLVVGVVEAGPLRGVQAAASLRPELEELGVKVTGQPTAVELVVFDAQYRCVACGGFPEPDDGARCEHCAAFYDMHGNVWEPCEDMFVEGYRDAPVDGSPNLWGTDSSNRVIRGGSYDNPLEFARSAARGGTSPRRYAPSIAPIGCRPVRSLDA